VEENKAHLTFTWRRRYFCWYSDVWRSPKVLFLSGMGRKK